MKTFDDKTGHTWEVELNVYLAGRLRDLLDFDPLQADGKTLIALSDDPARVVNIVWVLIEDQAAKQDPPLSDEEFGRRIDGDAFEAMTTAFLEAFVDFFPKRRREIMGALLNEARAADDRRLDRAVAQISQEGYLAEMMDKELERIDNEESENEKAADSGAKSTA